MPYALFDQDGDLYAAAPNKDVRDEIFNRYFDRHEIELAVQEISSAAYEEIKQDFAALEQMYRAT